MIPDKLLAIIRKFEGLRLAPYRCPAGVATIGYGHTGPEVTMDMAPISEAVAEAMMCSDAARFMKASVKLSPVLAENSDRLSAIADFCFNLGTTRYKSSTLRRCIDSGDWDGAREEIMRWNKCGGRVLQGLTMRRMEDAELLS